MPGSPLDLEYPVTGDSVYDVLRKFSDNFQTLETDLEAKVSESDILVGGPLSVRDNPIQDVGQVVMSPQVVAPTAEGTLSYANGSWYVADAVGAIRLTDGSGGFNSSGFKGIGGDYGAGDPSEVTYSASAGLYEFTDDPGVYSDGAFEAVKFMRAAGSIAVSAPSGVTGALTLTLPEPPASGSPLLTLSSAGVMATATTITPATTFTDLTVTTLRRPSQTKAIPLCEAVANGSSTFTRSLTDLAATSATCVIVFPVRLDIGQKITSATAYIERRVAVDTCTVEIFKHGNTGAARTTLATGTDTTTIGALTLTATYGSPVACAANETFYVKVTLPKVTDNLYALYIVTEG